MAYSNLSVTFRNIDDQMITDILGEIEDRFPAVEHIIIELHHIPED